MVRRRRFELAYLLGSLLLLPASLHSPTAYAAPGDPPAGSPAGAVYQLPLEQGRADAAPKGGGGTEAEAGGGTGASTGGGGSGGGGQSESGSLYRSENNFGSSSQVPGAAAAGAHAGAGGGGAAGTGASAGGGSAGDGKAGAAGAAIAGGAVAAETADTGNTSVPASVVLLAAIGLLAIAVGVLSRRFRAS
jgi:hypothetical protein